MTQEIFLKRGRHYLVKHYGSSKFVRRFFKGYEKRFDSILCYVFSSKIDKKLEIIWDDKDKTFTIRGNKLPAQEISIPFYDLIKIKEA